MLYEGKEQMKNLEIQSNNKAKDFAELSKSKTALKVELSKTKLKRDEVLHDLHLAKQQFIDINALLKVEEDVRSKLEKELRFRDESETALREHLEGAETQLSQKSQQFNNLEKIISEKNAEIKKLRVR